MNFKVGDRVNLISAPTWLTPSEKDWLTYTPRTIKEISNTSYFRLQNDPYDNWFHFSNFSKAEQSIKYVTPRILFNGPPNHWADNYKKIWINLPKYSIYKVRDQTDKSIELCARTGYWFPIEYFDVIDPAIAEKYKKEVATVTLNMPPVKEEIDWTSANFYDFSQTISSDRILYKEANCEFNVGDQVIANGVLSTVNKVISPTQLEIQLLGGTIVNMLTSEVTKYPATYCDTGKPVENIENNVLENENDVTRMSKVLEELEDNLEDKRTYESLRSQNLAAMQNKMEQVNSILERLAGREKLFNPIPYALFALFGLPILIGGGFTLLRYLLS